MAVLTKGAYICACSREVCDWSCTTYVKMLSDSAPNTAWAKPFNNLSKPTTNADRIRAMSDEELAEKFFLFPCVHVLDDKVKCKDDGCKKCWMRWLREECKNEN